MLIFAAKEVHPGERRVPLDPPAARKIAQLEGADLAVESGLGEACRWTDADYEGAGARIVTDRAAALAEADCVLRLRKPAVEEVAKQKAGALHISYLEPFEAFDVLDALAEHHVDAIAMEMIPRTTLAQKMDALSSQANLGGYVAVVVAAERLDRILPMMMTPAGTIAPARVFIVGAGVAGLQAIATAKRLGARVEAFDTRPVVKEQVQSLGAKFLEIDLGETGETKGGYAKELTPEQQERQREGMAKACEQADIVITTAQVFGRKAPRIITADMVERMKPGSVVVDMAVETGGNVEGSKLGEEVETGGVRIVGLPNLPGHVPVDASQMYGANLASLIGHFWNAEAGTLERDLDDEIMQGCLIVRDGSITNDLILNARGKAAK